MRKLWVRLLGAFLLVTLLAVGAVALVVRAATESNFRHYIDQRNAFQPSPAMIAALEAHYVETGTWAGSEDLLSGDRGSGGGQGGDGQGGGGPGRGAQLAVADLAGVIAAATDPDLLGLTLDENARQFAAPLTFEGQTAAWLARISPGQQALGEAETRFLADMSAWLAAAMAGAVALAVLASTLLARQLARPLRAITGAAHELAAGALGQQVEVKGADEIAALAEAFNQMSRRLAEGEALRQRMTADIAHELRTPISILRGHLEAMLDGVFPADSEHLAVPYNQTLHLARLVDDLRLLTLAEAGRLPLNRARLAPGDLVSQAVARFAPLALDAGISLRQHMAPDLPPVDVDPDRLHQVLGNLLSNALRHTPPDGEITVSVEQHPDEVWIAVRNTGDTIAPDQLAHIFDRFWRAQDARERDSGGSGLGLAIVQQLVTLHGGRIWAESESGTSTFTAALPAQAHNPPITSS